MKSFARKLVKTGLVPSGMMSIRPAGVHFLIYHKVAGSSRSEIDLPVALFRRQAEFLSRTGRVVSYDRAVHLLQNKDGVKEDRFVLTFDDGYDDFYTNVFPILSDFGLPATLFVTTGFIEGMIENPLSRPSFEARPLSWEMLGRVQESGLITVGGHTHTHPNLVGISEARLNEEIRLSTDCFRKRLGIEVEHFAYPRALFDNHSEAVVKQHYRSAVLGGGNKATAERFNRYQIPRVPVRRSDGWLFFLAKLRGWLAAEEKVNEKLKSTVLGI